jgi:hypothetical protein
LNNITFVRDRTGQGLGLEGDIGDVEEAEEAEEDEHDSDLEDQAQSHKKTGHQLDLEKEWGLGGNEAERSRHRPLQDSDRSDADSDAEEATIGEDEEEQQVISRLTLLIAAIRRQS